MARLVRVEGNALYVVGVDCLDNTPLLDIKPYFASTDSVADAVVGWHARRQAEPLAQPRGRLAAVQALVRDVADCDCALLDQAARDLHRKFEIQHATLQFETVDHHCHLAADEKV